MQSSESGVTLVELIAVIVIMAVLGAIALGSLSMIGRGAREEEAGQELERLAFAIAGNPSLENSGTRSDFGYVGDIGALPPDLDALRANPGYATWRGPYINPAFSREASDFKIDPWGKPYELNGVELVSLGSGSTVSRKLASSPAALLRNAVAGVVLNANGAPPGAVYCDSIEIALTCPDGLGAMVTRVQHVDPGGYFVFDSIPSGNQDLQIVYHPDRDTLHRFVSVLPGADHYGEYYLNAVIRGTVDLTGSGLALVADSDTLGSPDCSRLSFWILNETTSPVAVAELTLVCTPQDAYFETVAWDDATAYEGSPLKCGETATFDSRRELPVGASARVTIGGFRSATRGGAAVDMRGVTFTVLFSDGSRVVFTANRCN